MPAQAEEAENERHANSQKNSRVLSRKKMVGARRFELLTFCTPSKRATRLRHAPTVECLTTSEIASGSFQCGPPALPWTSVTNGAENYPNAWCRSTIFIDNELPMDGRLTFPYDPPPRKTVF